MRSEERAHNERLANDRYREAGRDKHPLRSLRSLLFCILYFSCFIALVSCHYSRPNLEDEHLSKETRDSLAYLFERHYTWNTNLEVLADSVNLACLPVKDCYNMLYRGDRVVVAEFAIHPADSVDSVWVKLAHSQEMQGWLRESEMMHAFVPTDSISQAIYLFSDTHQKSRKHKRYLERRQGRIKIEVLPRLRRKHLYRFVNSGTERHQQT